MPAPWHSHTAVPSFLAPRGLRPLRSEALSGLGCACQCIPWSCRSTWRCSPSQRRRILKRDVIRVQPAGEPPGLWTNEGSQRQAGIYLAVKGVAILAPSRFAPASLGRHVPDSSACGMLSLQTRAPEIESGWHGEKTRRSFFAIYLVLIQHAKPETKLSPAFSIPG